MKLSPKARKCVERARKILAAHTGKKITLKTIGKSAPLFVEFSDGSNIQVGAYFYADGLRVIPAIGSVGITDAMFRSDDKDFDQRIAQIHIDAIKREADRHIMKINAERNGNILRDIQTKFGRNNGAYAFVSHAWKKGQFGVAVNFSVNELTQEQTDQVMGKLLGVIQELGSLGKIDVR